MTANATNRSALDAFRCVLTTRYDYSLKGRGSVGMVDATDLPPICIRIDPRSFRVMDVENLQGAAAEIREKLGWQPRTRLEYLVAGIVREVLQAAERDDLVRCSGYAVISHDE